MPSPPLCNRALANHGWFSRSGCQAHSAVFIRVLGLFQAFAFHPFIEQLARILNSIKLNEFFLGSKSGPQNLRPMFC